MRPGQILEFTNSCIYLFNPGSQKILDSMVRDHTLDEFWEVVNVFRKYHLEMMIITDIITGFPGETDQDHQDTVDLLHALSPDLVNVTRFSPRKGTPASKYKRVNGRIVKKRSRELTSLRKRIRG